MELEKLLGHHATLAVRLMRAQLRDDPDLLETSVAALARNTKDLGAVVGQVYGAQGRKQFEQLWLDHTVAFAAYAKGLVRDDQQLRRRANDSLEAYRREFGAFMEAATDGELPAADVSAGLQIHIKHLLGQADAYAAGDYGRAYTLQRTAYAHMFPTGLTLAGGIASHGPAEIPAHFDAPPQRLRSTLGMLLGEHVELVIDTTRAGLRGDRDFPQAAAALDGNTQDLAAAMDTVVGGDAGRRFTKLWGDHIDLLLDYAVGTAEQDDAAVTRARQGLSAYEDSFGRYLWQATGRRLAAPSLSAVVREHDEQLLRQIDAYAAAEYEAAHDIAFESYQHMFTTAGQLAQAITQGTAGRLPKGGAQTGGGGTAGRGHVSR
ncbi:MAG: hypothetical protein ACRDU8_07280, partial [Egibacteraceae bacterium]